MLRKRLVSLPNSDYAANNTMSDREATILFLKLIKDLCDAYDEAPPRMGRSLLLVSNTMAHIDQHFREALCVEELAQIGGLSLRSFQRHFLRAGGMTVVRYIARRRLEEACRLLKEGRTNIAETALQSGFRDPNYFSRTFKETYGMTAKQYQQRAAKYRRPRGRASIYTCGV